MINPRAAFVFFAIGGLASFMVGEIKHVFTADTASHEVATTLGVDEDELRSSLERALGRTAQREAVFMAAPWVLAAGYVLAVRPKKTP